MMMTANPTVVVEPDSAGAWLGLIGVVIGVVITAGANWIQSRAQGRNERQRELDAATGQVTASAMSVILLVRQRADANGQVASSTTGGADADWAEKITAAAERMQLADQVISRYGQPALIPFSRTVVNKALNFAFVGGEPEETAAHAAIDAFQAELVTR